VSGKVLQGGPGDRAWNALAFSVDRKYEAVPIPPRLRSKRFIPSDFISCQRFTLVSPLNNRLLKTRLNIYGDESACSRTFAIVFGFREPRVAIADVPPVRELKRKRHQAGTSPTMRCAYFGLPGWAIDEGAAAVLSGGATRGEKEGFSASPKSNAVTANTKIIRPLVIVGLVAGLRR
jgi:hypothetical protein